VYALRLPVSYQHGRYLMPTIPLLIILGVGGTAALLKHITLAGRRRLAGVALLFAMLILVVGFTILGAQGYVADVEYIDEEMVTVAHWLATNTPADALIAAHDIGAIGYFARRPLLDLAGLISPEIIPIMHDGPALLDYMRAHQVGYLATFPSWYPTMTASLLLEKVYQTEGARARAAGLDNMAVYRFIKP